MKLYVRHMCCIRCVRIVKSALEETGIRDACVHLGQITVVENIPQNKVAALDKQLAKSGFELVGLRKSRLIEKIKAVIIEQVHYMRDLPEVKFSEHLSRKLHYDYTYLANLFSEVTGTTIEKYMIWHKIERVKELMIYEQKTLTEIASSMHYSSVAHLSRQFKQVVGETPVSFRNKNRRSPA